MSTFVRPSSEFERNPGVALDMAWVEKSRVNLPATIRRSNTHKTRRSVKKSWQAAWLLRATACIDLTTLAGDDTATNAKRIAYKAAKPIRTDLLASEKLGSGHFNDITCGAICVYPNRVPDVLEALKEIGAEKTVPIASVATGFPTGQTPLSTRIEEVKMAVAAGATEIDMVITRPFVLGAQWTELYDEVKAIREACGEAHLKTILATGDLGTLTNVYKASLIAMMAGSDFIKTSTGKEGVNAIFPVAFTMVRAIRDYHERTGFKVGFKPAGGIRSAKDALSWLSMMKEELGDDWTKPDLFRIGASALLGDIERQIYHYCTGTYAAGFKFAVA